METYEVIRLDIYAVETRYPGDYVAVIRVEFEAHLEVVEQCFKWIESIINPLITTH